MLASKGSSQELIVRSTHLKHTGWEWDFSKQKLGLFSYSPLHLCSHLAPTPVWPGTWNTTNILPRTCGSTPQPQIRDWELCFCKERPILPTTCLHQGPIPHSSAWSLVTCLKNSSAMSLSTFCRQCTCPNSPKFFSLSMLVFLNWTIVDLQYCVVSGVQQNDSYIYIYIYNIYIYIYSFFNSFPL